MSSVSKPGLAGVQLDDVVDRRQDVVLGEDALVDRQRQLELLVDLVATDLGEVVALALKKRFSSSVCATRGSAARPGRSLR
jgi:hypothetical protein